MKVLLETGARIPDRAHDTDAGLDLFSRETKTIPAHGSCVFDTGVHIELPAGTVGFLKSKSGLNVRYGITGEGVIDEEFSNTDETAVDDSNVEDADTKTNTVREISPETIILPEPTRDGYTFVEQNTRIDGEGTSYQAGDEIEVVPMSLYAIWKENELTE